MQAVKMQRNSYKEKDIEHDEVEINLSEIFYVLIGKWKILLLSFIITAAAVFGITKFMIAPKYKASSMIYVLGKSSGSTDAINLQLSQQVTVDFQILATSRPVIEAVIDDCQLSLTYEDMIKKISVSNPTGTNILKMTITDEDPQQSADIANALSKETEEQIEKVMVTEKLSSVEDAVAPTTPSSPSVAKDTFLAGIFGMFVMAIILMVCHVSDDTIKTEEDVRKYLGLATLASFPIDDDIVKKKKTQQRRKRRRR